ncbi:MAG: FAD-dependent monooxygenase [Polaromonas sp.]|uniref:FAD-dependent oxidoreductase n=1 Tax=Polaromonas sp. TaxID=1869339 RepID=UPI0025F5E87B|nr:FAD-dependent monooxygenase [Polaromonas sp.]MBI2725378.1 FAD-dependent monooxygenase [Polaromonas sp.]
MEHYQVIIAGAGPVGSVAAYRLAERGIKVLLLESEPGVKEDMRASTFHASTLEMMEELGVLDDLLAQGLKAPVYQYLNRQTGKALTLDLTEVADVLKHPYRLQCEQFKLARLLYKRLADHPNATVLYSHRVVHFSQDDKGVTVHAENPFEIAHFTGDYLIAADGASSLVRKWLGVKFEGFTYPEKFLTLSTEWPLEKHFDKLPYVSYVADPTEWCVLLRVPTLWRVLVPAAESQSDEYLLSDEKKNAIFQGLIGHGEEVKTKHRTIYRVHQRVATTFRVNRVLLAGDAAHLNNPLGGLGMNSGIHDVWNLTDKLLQIFQQGGNADALLDLYDRQRRTIMNEFVQTQTIKNKKALETSAENRQSQAESEMARIVGDREARRNYMLEQSMHNSLKRAEAII